MSLKHIKYTNKTKYDAATKDDSTVYYVAEDKADGPETYLKSASVSGNTLTLTKQDDTTVAFTPQSGGGDVFWVVEGTTTIAEIASAIASNKIVVDKHNGRIYQYGYESPAGTYHFAAWFSNQVLERRVYGAGTGTWASKTYYFPEKKYIHRITCQYSEGCYDIGVSFEFVDSTSTPYTSADIDDLLYKLLNGEGSWKAGVSGGAINNDVGDNHVLCNVSYDPDMGDYYFHTLNVSQQTFDTINLWMDGTASELTDNVTETVSTYM